MIDEREMPPGAVRVVKAQRWLPEEWAAVVERAQACGLSPTRYVRETALGVIVRTRRHQEHTELIRQLARIGTTLSELAAFVRTGGAVPAAGAVDATLREVLEAIRRLDRASAGRERPATAAEPGGPNGPA